MSNRKNNMIWGGVFIVLGALLLLDSFNLIPEFSDLVWAAILGVTCLFFIGVYFYTGRKHWPWLFPIFISGGMAVVAALSLTDFNSLYLGALFMGSLAIPFWIVYFINRKENWWALIPGWAMAVLTFIILISETWSGEVIGALVMWSISLPFIIVYLRNRSYWWALIPGFIMAGMGLVVLLATQDLESVIGTFVMLVIALPFFGVFFFTKGQWWAIIPAGILTTIALIIPFATRAEGNTFVGQLVAFVMFLGFAVPFVWLWLQRQVYPTGWAKYPAVGFILAGFVTLALGNILETGWPVILIAIGVWLLIDNFRQPKLKP